MNNTSINQKISLIAQEVSKRGNITQSHYKSSKKHLLEDGSFFTPNFEEGITPSIDKCLDLMALSGVQPKNSYSREI